MFLLYILFQIPPTKRQSTLHFSPQSSQSSHYSGVTSNPSSGGQVKKTPLSVSGFYSSGRRNMPVKSSLRYRTGRVNGSVPVGSTSHNHHHHHRLCRRHHHHHHHQCAHHYCHHHHYHHYPPDNPDKERYESVIHYETVPRSQGWSNSVLGQCFGNRTKKNVTVSVVV